MQICRDALLDRRAGIGHYGRVADFPEYLRARAIEGLRSLDAGHRADAYVVSFYVWNDDDDFRFPALTIGTNTESQVRLALEPPAGFVKPNSSWKPTDEQEARWNYAFWLQNELTIVGSQANDPAGALLRRAWLESKGLWVEDYEEALELDGHPTHEFVHLCVQTVQNLHSSGVTKEIFSRPIPVIIHELEYYDEIATQNLEANGPDLAGGLLEWMGEVPPDLVRRHLLDAVKELDSREK